MTLAVQPLPAELAILIVCGLLCWVMPDVIDVWDVDGIELPFPSQLAVTWSRLLVDYWYALLPALLFVDGVMLISLGLLPSWLRWLQGLWFGAGMLATVIMLALLILGIAMPIVR